MEGVSVGGLFDHVAHLWVTRSDCILSWLKCVINLEDWGLRIESCWICDDLIENCHWSHWNGWYVEFCGFEKEWIDGEIQCKKSMRNVVDQAAHVWETHSACICIPLYGIINLEGWGLRAVGFATIWSNSAIDSTEMGYIYGMTRLKISWSVAYGSVAHPSVLNPILITFGFTYKISSVLKIRDTTVGFVTIMNSISAIDSTFDAKASVVRRFSVGIILCFCS